MALASSLTLNKITTTRLREKREEKVQDEINFENWIKFCLCFYAFIVLTNDEICFSPTRIIQWTLLAIDVTDTGGEVACSTRDPLCPAPPHMERSIFHVHMDCAAHPSIIGWSEKVWFSSIMICQRNLTAFVKPFHADIFSSRGFAIKELDATAFCCLSAINSQKMGQLKVLVDFSPLCTVKLESTFLYWAWVNFSPQCTVKL